MKGLRYGILCGIFIELTWRHALRTQWQVLALLLLWMVLVHWRKQPWQFVMDWLLSGILAIVFGYSGVFLSLLTLFDVCAQLPFRQAMVWGSITSVVYVWTARGDFSSMGIFLLCAAMLVAYFEQFYRAKKLTQRLYEVEQQMVQHEQQLAQLANHQDTLKEMYVLQERQRISRDIHDSVGHSLSTIIIQLGALSATSRAQQPDLAEMLDELRQFSVESLQSVRKIVHDLKPIALEKHSLLEAIGALLKQAQQGNVLDIRYRHNQESFTLSDLQAQTLYFIVQELVANTLKYAQATQLTVTLMYAAHEVILTVKDNGVGTDDLQLLGGLQQMKQRVSELKGKCYFQTRKQQGFQAQIILPKGASK
ncbi:MAG: sensor histidine kinase [Aerococcaceae bacterium]|nr:sensor histidine kinase [Aerococcaceae bacterium]